MPKLSKWQITHAGCHATITKMKERHAQEVAALTARIEALEEQISRATVRSGGALYGG